MPISNRTRLGKNRRADADERAQGADQRRGRNEERQRRIHRDSIARSDSAPTRAPAGSSAASARTAGPAADTKDRATCARYPCRLSLEIDGPVPGEALRQPRAHHGGAEQGQQQQQRVQPVAMTRTRIETPRANAYRPASGRRVRAMPERWQMTESRWSTQQPADGYWSVCSSLPGLKRTAFPEESRLPRRCADCGRCRSCAAAR